MVVVAQEVERVVHQPEGQRLDPCLESVARIVVLYERVAELYWEAL